MHSLVSFILPAALFFILSPGILTRIPKNGSKYLVALFHSIIFAILLHFLMSYLPMHEGYTPPSSNLPVWAIVLIVLLVVIVFGAFAAGGNSM